MRRLTLRNIIDLSLVPVALGVVTTVIVCHLGSRLARRVLFWE